MCEQHFDYRGDPLASHVLGCKGQSTSECFEMRKVENGERQKNKGR